jgi:hypothetical protein
MAAIKGSEKQVAWAESERTKFLAEMDRFIAETQKELAEPPYGYETEEQIAKKRARLDAQIATYNAAAAAALEVVSARAWIDLLRTQGAERCVKILTTPDGQKALAKYT